MFEVIKNAGTPSPVNQYPFAKLEVGDAFDAPRDMKSCSTKRDTRQVSILNAARYYSKHYNPEAKFTTRIIDENTVRCWRIA